MPELDKDEEEFWDLVEEEDVEKVRLSKQSSEWKKRYSGNIVARLMSNSRFI